MSSAAVRSGAEIGIGVPRSRHVQGVSVSHRLYALYDGHVARDGRNYTS